MPDKKLFPGESPVAQRQPKTDRLILARFLEEAARKTVLDEQEMRTGHAVLLKWAELERAGRLAKLNETQMQGDFLAQVFGEALGYAGPLDGKEVWHREQHHSIAGETPDAILGFFRQGYEHQPLAVVELKGPLVHLDRHRSNGRTAVGQCWDYMVNTPPACRWGIISNYVSFRLYERSSTKGVYEHFTLQSLVNYEVYKQFHVLFHRQGLIESVSNTLPRAVALLKQSTDRQREVSDTLYSAYSENRTSLIAELHFNQRRPLDQAIEMAQRLFDRIMFIAFCEDRHLLPKDTIPKAHSVAGFQAVTNPRWQNFKNLFRFIDVGNQDHDIPKYNGGLFAPHAVDDLELPDSPWTTFFKTISGYDFADEVNLDVLGHLFERSITELEKLKESGLFGGDREKTREYAAMPQSAKRKQLGIYYTPQELTSRIVQYTVEELIAERFAALAVKSGIPAELANRGTTPEGVDYWRECLAILQRLKIVDPACGSGAFLFQAYSVLEQRYGEVIGHLEQLREPDAKGLAAQVPTFILQDNLYGVDLSPEAVEITQLALWIRSATPGQLLAKLSANIVHGNSLVHDPAVHPAGFDWRHRFEEVFDRPEQGFDCVIGNPPWERIKLQEREFFSLPAPKIASATDAAKRRQLVSDLKENDSAVYQLYKNALASSDALLTYCRTSGEYPLTGRGDINTYAVFAELASQLVSPNGRVGLLTPSGIASDNTTKDFFASISETNRLIRLFDFHNRLKIFAEVEGRLKFCILNFGGTASRCDEGQFMFFVEEVEELDDARRLITLSGKDIKLVNPNTRTCPIFKTNRDATLTKAIYRRVPILIDKSRSGPTGNPWNLSFLRMFDQTNDAEVFLEPDELKKRGFQPEGNRWIRGSEVCLPLYEAKMCRPYDHRHGSIYIKADNWYMQGQTVLSSSAEHQNPEFSVLPRYWTGQQEIEARLVDWKQPFLFAFRDIVRPTDHRTLIAHFLPRVGVLNTIPLLLSQAPARRICCLLDFVSRQKISQVHMNFFIVEQLPVLAPDVYSKSCPWDSRTTLETWISERVLKLTCTAEDMLPLADACGFSGGSFQAEYGGRLNKWDEAERAELMAELDAAFFHLYGLQRDDAEYILSTFKGIHDERTLFSTGASTAKRIVQKFTEMSFPS